MIRKTIYWELKGNFYIMAQKASSMYLLQSEHLSRFSTTWTRTYGCGRHIDNLFSKWKIKTKTHLKDS